MGTEINQQNCQAFASQNYTVGRGNGAWIGRYYVTN